MHAVCVTGLVIPVIVQSFCHPPNPFPSVPHPVPVPIHVLSTRFMSTPANTDAKFPSTLMSTFPVFVSVNGASVLLWQ